MRFAAVFLLTLMCLDIGMDLWQGETGDSDSGMTLAGAVPGQTFVAISEGPTRSDSKDFAHECFCCCSHLEPQEIAIVSVTLESSPTNSELPTYFLDPDLVRIYHPPQYV